MAIPAIAERGTGTGLWGIVLDQAVVPFMVGFRPKGPPLVPVLVIQDVMGRLLHLEAVRMEAYLGAGGLVKVPIGQGELASWSRSMGQGQPWGQEERPGKVAFFPAKPQFQPKMGAQKNIGLHKGGPKPVPLVT